MKTKPLQIIFGIVIASLILLYFVGNPFGKKQEGFSSSSSTFTMYAVDWCGHCQTTKPEFEPLIGTKKYNGNDVIISIVNPEETPEKAEGKTIKGFPTILFEKGGQTIEYSGERTNSGFIAFLEQNV